VRIDSVLKGHDLFRSLNLEEINLISGFSSVKNFDIGEIIFEYNKTASHVYMLMQGTVHLHLPAAPQEFNLVISKIEKGELFGLSPLLDWPRYTASASCIVPSEVLAIEARPFRDLLRKNCPAGFNVMTQVANIYFRRYIDVLKHLQGVVSRIPLIR
jgi:signal-transduction protein with cAMP-binding, CBS, and nucleotidyltransferase domain